MSAAADAACPVWTTLIGWSGERFESEGRGTSPHGLPPETRQWRDEQRPHRALETVYPETTAGEKRATSLK